MVRMYSWEVEGRLPPGSDALLLGQALGEEVKGDSLRSITEPWRRFFEMDEEMDKER